MKDRVKELRRVRASELAPHPPRRVPIGGRGPAPQPPAPDPDTERCGARAAPEAPPNREAGDGELPEAPVDPAQLRCPCPVCGDLMTPAALWRCETCAVLRVGGDTVERRLMEQIRKLRNAVSEVLSCEESRGCAKCVEMLRRAYYTTGPHYKEASKQ